MDRSSCLVVSERITLPACRTRTDSTRHEPLQQMQHEKHDGHICGKNKASEKIFQNVITGWNVAQGKLFVSTLQIHEKSKTKSQECRAEKLPHVQAATFQGINRPSKV